MYYFKAKGYDCCGLPCTVYIRSKIPFHSRETVEKYLYCKETGNSIATIHAPRLAYMFAYFYYTIKGKHTTPEEWSAEPISTVTIKRV